jgi:hypothetical protein
MSRGPGKIERLVYAILPRWGGSSWDAATAADFIFRHSAQDPLPTESQIDSVRRVLHRLQRCGTLYIDPYVSAARRSRHWRVTGVQQEDTGLQRAMRTKRDGTWSGR